MRIWSLHPKYLDSKGLVALWRETLLAQKVLAGQTKGYRQHPQLIRFREQSSPLAAVGSYLARVLAESENRGYHFDGSKILEPDFSGTIPVCRGQVAYEWEHLLKKLAVRDPERLERTISIGHPECHPLFTEIPGGIADWEIRQ